MSWKTTLARISSVLRSSRQTSSSRSRCGNLRLIKSLLLRFPLKSDGMPYQLHYVAVNRGYLQPTKYFRTFQTKFRRRRSKDCGGKTGETFASTYFVPGREKEEIYVATAFGICAGLLRQREFSKDSFILSKKFQEVRNAFNKIDLRGCEAKDDVDAQNNAGNNITPKTARIHKLESHLKLFQSKTAELFCTPPPTPGSRSQTYQEINLAEIAEDPSIGPTVKKRIIAKQCNEIITNLKNYLNPNTL